MKLNVWRISPNDSKWEVFKTNKKKEFCLRKFPSGYYVLKFGTNDGDWNCSWIKVFISAKNKDRKIKVDLSIGT